MSSDHVNSDRAGARVRVELPDEAATLRLGADLAPGLAPGRRIFLFGDLGAGKTTLVRGLLRALGWAGRVKSPTYSLVEHYMVSRLNLYHFDFYRLARQTEWLDAGFREHFNAHSVCLVEWPERAGAALGVPDLEVRIEIKPDSRTATLAAHTESGRIQLAALSAHSQSV